MDESLLKLVALLCRGLESLSDNGETDEIQELANESNTVTVRTNTLGTFVIDVARVEPPNTR